MSADDDQETLAAQDRARLYRALCGLPHITDILPASVNDLTMDRLFSILGSLSDRLRERDTREREQAAELMRYRALIAGGRQLVEVLLGNDVLIKGAQS